MVEWLEQLGYGAEGTFFEPFFSHTKIKHMGTLASKMTTFFIVVMEFLGKVYAHVSNLFICEKSDLYVTK